LTVRPKVLSQYNHPFKIEVYTFTSFPTAGLPQIKGDISNALTVDIVRFSLDDNTSKSALVNELQREVRAGRLWIPALLTECGPLYVVALCTTMSV